MICKDYAGPNKLHIDYIISKNVEKNFLEKKTKLLQKELRKIEDLDNNILNLSLKRKESEAEVMKLKFELTSH